MIGWLDVGLLHPARSEQPWPLNLTACSPLSRNDAVIIRRIGTMIVRSDRAAASRH
jgi:hypothetical protein